MTSESIYKSQAGESEIMALYDAVLARWPVPYETFNLTTRHGRTFVIASGEKSALPLILLHGAASNAVSWVERSLNTVPFPRLRSRHSRRTW
jgi:hypothetical protein